MGCPGWDGVAGMGQDDRAAGVEGQPVSLRLALWDLVTELLQGQEQWPSRESREVRLLPGAVLRAWTAGTRRSAETEGWKEVCDPILEMEPQINIYLLNRRQQEGCVHEQLGEESPDPSIPGEPESTKSRKMANA